MVSYNELLITWGGQQYIFVTRGRAKPFTPEEAIKYLQDREGTKEELKDLITITEEVQVELPTSDWRIPDDKMRRHIFRTDLQSGVDFCVKKYGQPEEVIKAEARRLALGGF